MHPQRKDKEKIKVDNLKVLKVLGEGRFGRVLLCICMENDQYYAVKAITKSSIKKDRIEKHITVPINNKY